MFKDRGYIQILHGGNASPAFLTIVVPTYDQLGIGAEMELEIPHQDAVKQEMIREELEFKNKIAVVGEAQHNGNEKTG